LRVVDLFCGIGGFRLGLEKAGGYRCVWSCDIDKYANRVYAYHWGWENHHPGDIREVEASSIPDHDILCAGFPCQAFSVAGKRKGFEDTRGTLFFEITRIARAKRPRILFLENVKGLLSHDRGHTFRVILEELGRIGYRCEWQVLNSKWFGVPQNRERTFIIGYLGGEPRRTIFPIRETGGVADEENGGRPELPVEVSTAIDSNYYKGVDRHGQRTMVQVATIDGKDNQANRIYHPAGVFPTVPTPGGGRHLPKIVDVFNSRVRSGEMNSLKTNPSPTSSAVLVLPIGYRRIRRLTPVECERLQAFPDNWTKYGLTEDGETVEISDTQRYKMLGNAVTVNVIEFIGRRIKEVIGG